MDSPSVENGINAARKKSLPLVQRKLRWGAIVLPQEVDDLAAIETGRIVSHLGFGGEKHDVTEPQEGGYYI